MQRVTFFTIFFLLLELSRGFPPVLVVNSGASNAPTIMQVLSTDDIHCSNMSAPKAVSVFAQLQCASATECAQSSGDTLLFLPDSLSVLVSVGCLQASAEEVCKRSLSAVYQVSLESAKSSVLLRANDVPSSPLSSLFRPYGLLDISPTFSQGHQLLIANLVSNTILSCAPSASCSVFATWNGTAFPGSLNGPNSMCAFPDGGSLFVTTEGTTPHCLNPSSCSVTFPGLPSLLLNYPLSSPSSQQPRVVFTSGPNGSLAGLQCNGNDSLLYATDFSLNLLYQLTPSGVLLGSYSTITPELPCLAASSCYTGEIHIFQNATASLLFLTVGSTQSSGGAVVYFAQRLPVKTLSGPHLFLPWSEQLDRPMGITIPVVDFPDDLC